MPTIFRLQELTESTVDNGSQDVNFLLKLNDGRELAFVADATAARQIASSLGQMALETSPLFSQMDPEHVTRYEIKRQAFGDVVLLQIMSREGLAHSFAIPLAAAQDIADQLKSESAKGAGSGGVGSQQ